MNHTVDTEHTEHGPCAECALLSASEAKKTYPCWDTKRCPGRRWDAKNREQRQERHKELYRLQRYREAMRRMPHRQAAADAHVLGLAIDIIKARGRAAVADLPRTVDQLDWGVELLELLRGRFQVLARPGTAERSQKATAAQREDGSPVGATGEQAFVEGYENALKGSLTRRYERLAATARIYRTEDGAVHAFVVQLWNYRTLVDERAEHTFHLGEQRTKQLLHEHLLSWGMKRMSELSYAPAQECPLRPCPRHGG